MAVNFIFKMAAPIDLTKQVSDDSRGRKRIRMPENWKKNLNKSKRYKLEGKLPQLDCPHLSKANYSRKRGIRGPGPKKVCCASELYKDDIKEFYDELCTRDKISQDLYLTQYIEAKQAASHRSRKDDARTPPIVITYCVPKTDGSMVTVCAKAFRGITQTSRDRLARLGRRANAGQLPRENRGGARILP